MICSDKLVYVVVGIVLTAQFAAGICAWLALLDLWGLS